MKHIITVSTNRIARLVMTHLGFANEGSLIAPSAGAGGLGMLPYFFIAFCHKLDVFVNGSLKLRSGLRREHRRTGGYRVQRRRQ